MREMDQSAVKEHRGDQPPVLVIEDHADALVGPPTAHLLAEGNNQGTPDRDHGDIHEHARPDQDRSTPSHAGSPTRATSGIARDPGRSSAPVAVTFATPGRARAARLARSASITPSGTSPARAALPIVSR